MAANDTIADMLTRIRNSCMARHETTKVPATKMTRSIAQVLKDEGFIAEFEESGEGVKKELVISLRAPVSVIAFKAGDHPRIGCLGGGAKLAPFSGAPAMLPRGFLKYRETQ